MDKGENCAVIRIGFPALNKLHKCVQLAGWRNGLVKAARQMFDQFAWIRAKIVRNEFLQIDWIAARFCGCLHPWPEGKITILAWRRLLRWRKRIPVDQVIGKVIAKQQSGCAYPAFA